MTERIHEDSAGRAAARRRGRRRRANRVRLAIAVALMLGFVVWMIVREVGGGSAVKPAAKAPALRVSASGLNAIATAIPSPVYWIGPKTGYTYEFTKTSGNQVYVRYLPAGVAAGSPDPYLTIGTYPVANAFAVTRKAAAAGGAVKVTIGVGGVAFYNSSAPGHVYFAYPGTSSQVEVYDPSPGRAARLVSSGQIRQVVTKVTASAARAVTPAAVKALSASLGQPIYWAGPADGMRYELSVTSAGNVYIRYLPAGVAVGSTRAYKTIGTYPVSDAFKVTAALAAKRGSVRVAAGGGAVAYYAESAPTHVYLAYPGSSFQIEVFDPSAARAHELVSSQAVAVVP